MKEAFLVAMGLMAMVFALAGLYLVAVALGLARPGHVQAGDEEAGCVFFIVAVAMLFIAGLLATIIASNIGLHVDFNLGNNA